MDHLRKQIIPSIFKCASVSHCDNSFRSSRAKFLTNGSIHTYQKYRFYRTKRKSREIWEKIFLFPETVKREAQSSLLDYLHSTRGLQYPDAQHISGNSPHFLNNLVKMVNNDSRSAGSISRYLRYHPINEFEPFFESMGLNPSEYSMFLPSKLIFLSDDQVLIHNYSVLCSRGFARNKIGAIYKEVPKIFRYCQGVLESKLKAFGKVGFDQLSLVKLIHSNPRLLEGNADKEFFRFLEKLKCLGIDQDWIFPQLLNENSYEWGYLSEALLLFRKLGFNEEKLGKVIINNPDILFGGSGRNVFSIMGFLWKFGCTQNNIYCIFSHFPPIQTGMFLKNLRNCYQILIDIEMPSHQIENVFSSHPLVLGSCSLKKVDSLLRTLNTGKKRLCKTILEDPHVLKKWVLGKRVEPFPTTGEIKKSKDMKIKFLLSLGFLENGGEMEVLKSLRGKGLELQERFDCLVNAGLDPKDVSTMIKGYPNILNQTKEVIEEKIDFLVNILGYPLSSLVSFPSYIAFNTQRTKLRVFMYNWLKDQGRVDPNLALKTIVASSEKSFVSRYVNQHPGGHDVWEDLKKGIQLQ
ncbi:unnamed protein product [Cuscuta epithymum]|uniref:Transcription termination factor MTEF18, mitochondrial-like n=1 Tax=Cuscuta epithymum TaxID=186058 RepID=A0AAV0FHA9_9ASTE|nr:unnamed protein product [Cuscuta epithymum]